MLAITNFHVALWRYCNQPFVTESYQEMDLSIDLTPLDYFW